jgi:hypothetical protein
MAKDEKEKTAVDLEREAQAKVEAAVKVPEKVDEPEEKA